MVKKGTLEWYRYVEEANTRLRSRLLAHTPKLPTESSQDWLRRIAIVYESKKVKAYET